MLSSGPATFTVEQKLSPFANRYRVLDPGGRLVAFAAQKRLALREKFTVYADEDSRVPLFTVQARQRLDFAARYDVTGPQGEPVGSFRKEALSSLLRSTFVIEQPGLPPVTVAERNPVVAVVRRFVDFPLLFHFDGRTPDGQLAFSSTKKFGLRDRYEVAVHLPGLDHRLALGLAVALDALQGR